MSKSGICGAIAVGAFLHVSLACVAAADDMRNVAACCGDNMFCASAANGISAHDMATVQAVSARPLAGLLKHFLR